jgi:hypothetical protein
MRTVGAALDELVQQIRAAGMRADVDPELLNLDPSAVWVQPRELRTEAPAVRTLVVWLYLIVKGDEAAHVITLLDDGLEALLELVDLAESDDVIDLSAAVLLPSNPTAPLPAYRLAVDLEL